MLLPLNADLHYRLWRPAAHSYFSALPETCATCQFEHSRYNNVAFSMEACNHHGTSLPLQVLVDGAQAYHKSDVDKSGLGMLIGMSCPVSTLLALHAAQLTSMSN